MSAKAFEPYQLAGKRKAVTDAVHAEDGVIFAQLMHSGRIGHPGLQEFVVPQELDEADILATIEDFASAARNAIDAGFDGVELHGANGYLIHQFLSAHTNRRDDRWGNGVSGRIRFAVEVARATSRAIGADKVGIRISPGTAVNDINDDPDHEATFLPLVRELAALNLAYLHLAERAGRELTDRIRAA